MSDRGVWITAEIADWPGLPVAMGLLGLIALGRLLGVAVHRREPENEFAPGKRLKLVRNITRAECPWLDHDLAAGTMIVEYRGPTYGLRKHDDLIFVSFEGGTPFFQLPIDSLVEAEHEAVRSS
jgi:hypothetical protein